MRFTAAILLIGALQVGAKGLAQKISFSGTNVPLSMVFHAIEEQTGYGVLMAKSTLEASKPVTVNLTNGSIDEVLKVCFSFQPWKLQYTISGRTISISKVVTEGPGVVIEGPTAVSGKVRSESGTPLSGATVTLKGTKKGGITNNNGEFLLQGIVPGKYTLEVSYVGFEIYKEDIVVTGQTINISAVLKQASNSLDEAQVIAYGEVSKRFQTGNVTTVKAKDIESQPVTNPLLALEGRVPGLVINQATGFAGSGVSIQIQGQNTISSSIGTDPLYVIDGVPYPSQLLYSLSSIQGSSTNFSGPSQAGFPAGTGSSLSFINPSDIESITVLKDADATSIYGSRAANGAIIITTKKGKAGKTTGDINVQNGWGHVTRELPLLNPKEYLEVRHEAFSNDGLMPNSNYDFDLTYWDTTRNTDWQKTLIGGTSQYTNVQGSVSGGNVSTQFLIGAGYHHETSVFPGNFGDKKGSLHFSFNNISPNQKFKVQLTGNYQVDNNQLPTNDLTQNAMQFAPDAPSLYNKDGSLNWAPLSNGNSTWLNPLAYLYNKYNNLTNNLTSNLMLSYQFLPGLVLKSSFGYTNLMSNQYLISPLSSTAPEMRASTLRSAQFTENNINSWIIEPQISYTRSLLFKGKLDLLAGATIEENNSSLKFQYGSGQNSDLVLRDITAAANVSDVSGYSTYKYNGLFGRINYNWQDKYVLNVNMRRDGSSRFGSENEFHNFGSIGAAWIFSNTSIVKDHLSFLSFGKLRATYGTTGNDQIGDYRYLSLYNSISVGTPYQGAVGLAPNGLSNPNLQWEETKKIQFGVDLGLLQDRILFNTTYYRNRSSNLLLPYALPLVTGFAGITENFPALVQNYGWEFTFNAKEIVTRNFRWTTNINLTIPQNKLLKFQNLAQSSYADQLEIGKPVAILKLYHFLGVDPTTGLWLVSDYAGKPTTTPNYQTDRTVVKNTAPTFYGGLLNSLIYKSLQLDFLFQFVKQNATNYIFGDYNPGAFASGSSGSSGNEPRTVLNHWQKPGDNALIERYSTIAYRPTTFNTAGSDAAFSDASYIRLKNVSLSWQMPEAWCSKSHLSSVRFYAQGQNLLTITKYKGLDPETKSSITLPPLRVITIGIQVTL